MISKLRPGVSRRGRELQAQRTAQHTQRLQESYKLDCLLGTASSQHDWSVEFGEGVWKNEATEARAPSSDHAESWDPSPTGLVNA